MQAKLVVVTRSRQSRRRRRGRRRAVRFFMQRDRLAEVVRPRVAEVRGQPYERNGEKKQ